MVSSMLKVGHTRGRAWGHSGEYWACHGPGLRFHMPQGCIACGGSFPLTHNEIIKLSDIQLVPTLTYRLIYNSLPQDKLDKLDFRIWSHISKTGKLSFCTPEETKYSTNHSFGLDITKISIITHVQAVNHILRYSGIITLCNTVQHCTTLYMCNTKQKCTTQNSTVQERRTPNNTVQNCTTLRMQHCTTI